jgi:hypothetical protein
LWKNRDSQRLDPFAVRCDCELPLVPSCITRMTRPPTCVRTRRTSNGRKVEDDDDVFLPRNTRRESRVGARQRRAKEHVQLVPAPTGRRRVPWSSNRNKQSKMHYKALLQSVNTNTILFCSHSNVCMYVSRMSELASGYTKRSASLVIVKEPSTRPVRTYFHGRPGID